MTHSAISQFMRAARYFLALLIIGLQSVSPVQANQDNASWVGPDGNTWREYKADSILIADSIVGSLNIDGQVACASIDGKECAQGYTLSNFSENPSLLKHVLCENLSGDALNKLSVGPCQYLRKRREIGDSWKSWSKMEFYDIYTGEIREIIASMEYGANGEIACASFDGKKCLSAKDHDVSEIEYDKNLKALVCGPQKTYFPFGQVPSVSREMDWCGEIYLQKRFFSATPSGAGWGLMELGSQHYLTNYTHGPDGEVTCILRTYDKSCLNLASFMPYNPSTKPVFSKRHLDRMSIYACKPGERVSGPGAADVDVCGHALSVKNGIQQNLNSLYETKSGSCYRKDRSVGAFAAEPAVQDDTYCDPMSNKEHFEKSMLMPSAFWHADNVKIKFPDRGGTWTMDAKLAYGEGKTSNSIILPFHIGKNYDNMSSAQNGGYWGINILSKPVYPASELEIGRNDTVQRSIVDVVSYRAYDQVSDKRFLRTEMEVTLGEVRDRVVMNIEDEVGPDGRTYPAAIPTLMATFDTANDQIIFALHRTYADGSVSLDKDNVIVRKMSVGGDNHGLDEEKKSALNRGMLASFMGGDFVIQGFSSRDYYGGGQSIPYLYVYNPRLVQDNLPSRYNHMDYFSGSRKQLDKLMLSTQDGVMRTTFAAINDDKVSINQSNVDARTVFEGIPIASPKNGGCGLTTNGASACRSDDGDLAIILDGLGTILIPYENQGAQK